jgi:hypothetical protein
VEFYSEASEGALLLRQVRTVEFYSETSEGAPLLRHGKTVEFYSTSLYIAYT